MEAVSQAELVTGVEAGGVLFDVRPAPKRTFGLEPHPLNLGALQAGVVPELAHDTPVYLICERGQVSELAGLYLEATGFTQVYHLAGGTKAWPD